MRPARAAADMAIRAQRVCDWSVVVERKDAGETRAIRRAWTRLLRDVMTAKSQRHVTVTLVRSLSRGRHGPRCQHLALQVRPPLARYSV